MRSVVKPVEDVEEQGFDFAIEDIADYYDVGDSDSGDEAEKSLLKDEAPNVRRVRSKYTNGMRMLEIIATVIETAAKYSLKIYGGSTELSDFRKHKGCYITIYMMVKPMVGKFVTDHIERIEKAYEKVIKRYESKSTNANKDLLMKVAKMYEEKISHLMMVSKVSFETERMGSGPIARQRILS